MSVRAKSKISWLEVKEVIDRVHHHFCGLANSTDFKRLFERDNMWNDTVISYVAELVRDSIACHAIAPPQPSRKVSISSLFQNSKHINYVDHIFSDDIKLVHSMDKTTGHSTAHVVNSVHIAEVVYAYDLTWTANFWKPNSIVGDKAFRVSEFVVFLSSLGINFKMIHAGRHGINKILRRHGFIRSIFLRLKDASVNHHDSSIVAVEAVVISNSLYGNDIMSVFKLLQGFSRSIIAGQSVESISNHILKARE